MSLRRKKVRLVLAALLVADARVRAAQPRTLSDFEGDRLRSRSLVGPMTKREFVDAASRFLGPAEITLGLLASYGSPRDYELAGPGPVMDHCSYGLWRSIFDRYRPDRTGCVAVQEALKVGSAILYRSVDGQCRQGSELLQGRASPLDLVVDGHRMQILEMHFHRPWGKENLRRVGAEVYLRTNEPATVALARVATARLEAVTGAADIDIILRSDSWFFDVCGFPTVYPFESLAKVPTQEEFLGRRYASCGFFPPSSIRCLEMSPGRAP
jgi:hypothetical protein